MEKAREFVRKLKNDRGNYEFTTDQLREFVEIMSSEIETEVRQKLMRSVQEYYLNELQKG